MTQRNILQELDARFGGRDGGWVPGSLGSQPVAAPQPVGQPIQPMQSSLTSPPQDESRPVQSSLTSPPQDESRPVQSSLTSPPQDESRPVQPTLQTIFPQHTNADEGTHSIQGAVAEEGGCAVTHLSETGRSPYEEGHPLAGLTMNTRSARQGMILSEVLGPPVSRRRRRF